MIKLEELQCIGETNHIMVTMGAMFFYALLVGIIIFVYFLIWLIFHYLWMKQKLPHPDYLYWTLPVVLILLNSKIIGAEKKTVRYLKVFSATFISCVIWVWLIWFLGVAFHWHLGGML